MKYIAATIICIAFCTFANGQALREITKENFQKLHMHSKKIKFCNDLAYVDYGAAVDGPAYYFNWVENKKISTCGGACMMKGNECQNNCPPKEWKCNIY